MQLTPIVILDRMGGGTLHAQLLSSQTSGTFQIDNASALGTQLVTLAAGNNVLVTIESEQILCSGFSVSGSTVTLTIATNGRGTNSQAVTHSAGVAVEMHYTKAHNDNINNHIKQFDAAGLIIPSGFSVTPTVTNATTLSVAGVDVSAIATVGRVLWVLISGVWYRNVIRSSTFSANTTINVSSDNMPGSGTITDYGFEFWGSTKNAPDYLLFREATNDPASNPPSGYSFVYFKSGNIYVKNSAGTVNSYATAPNVQAGAYSYAADAGGSDAYAITLSPVPAGYTTGMIVTFKANTANTGASTLNVNSLGAKTIKRTGTTDTKTGDILANQLVTVVYDGTNFVIVGLLPSIVTKRVVSVTQAAAPTFNTDDGDIFTITGLAQAITSMTTNMTGTFASEQFIEFQITDNGTARAITWGANFQSTTVPLPSTTVISTRLRVLFQYNSVASKWDCIAVA